MQAIRRQIRDVIAVITSIVIDEGASHDERSRDTPSHSSQNKYLPDLEVFGT